MDIDQFQPTSLNLRADRIRQNVNIFDIFRYLGIESLVKFPDSTSQMKCPYHGHDIHPSARVYKDTNSFYCFKCRISLDQIGMVAQYKGVSIYDAIVAIEGFCNLPEIDYTDENLDTMKKSLEYVDPKFDSQLTQAVMDKIIAVKEFLTADQYIVIWKYYDFLFIEHKELKTLELNDFENRLAELLGKLNLIIKNRGVA